MYKFVLKAASHTIFFDK